MPYAAILLRSLYKKAASLQLGLSPGFSSHSHFLSLHIYDKQIVLFAVPSAQIPCLPRCRIPGKGKSSCVFKALCRSIRQDDYYNKFLVICRFQSKPLILAKNGGKSEIYFKKSKPNLNLKTKNNLCGFSNKVANSVFGIPNSNPIRQYV